MTPSGDPEVVVVGLGFVGLTFAVSLATKGFRVFGIDNNEEVIHTLLRGNAHFHEQGLEPALREQLDIGRLRVGASLADAWTSGSPRIVVLAVGTPRGLASWHSGAMRDLYEELRALLSGDELIVLRSTVGLGTTQALWEAFKRAGMRVNVAMCPERTVEGQALRELSELPQIVGGVDRKSSQLATEFFRRQGVPIVTVSSPQSAELTKLASNTYRDLQFAFANELAAIATAVGVDPYELVEATNRDYPRARIAIPGPVGGPCLEKDPWILAESARDFGIDARISRAARLTNESVPDRIASEVLGLVNLEAPTTKIAIAGLAFKGRPGTSDLRGSPSMALVKRLSEAAPSASVALWDPLITEVGPGSVPENCYVCSTFEECLSDTSLVIIMTNHPVFSTSEFQAALAKLPQHVPVFDAWPTFNTRPSLEHSSDELA